MVPRVEMVSRERRDGRGWEWEEAMNVEFLRSVRRRSALGVGGILGLLVLGCSGVGDATGSEATGQTREAVLSEMPLLTFPGIVSDGNPPDTIGEVGPN